MYEARQNSNVTSRVIKKHDNKKTHQYLHNMLSFTVTQQYKPIAIKSNNSICYPIQRQIVVKDYGGIKTRKWYGKEIEETGTDKMLDGISYSQSDGSGIFLSDSIYDWHHVTDIGTNNDVMRVVLPNMESQNTNDLNNILSLEDNCKMIALHELTHLKHANVYVKKFGNPLYAITLADEFQQKNLINTVNKLQSMVSELEDHIGIMLIDNMHKIKTYLEVRLQYIIDVFCNNGRNSEGPAVMRELNRYLTLVIIKLKEQKPKQNINQIDILTKIHKEVRRLDNICTKKICDIEK